MLQFICDYCGNSKEPGETWINGVAAENVGTQAARREVIIDPSWRRERALLAFAVHFCSLQCRDNYLAGLFSKPPTLLEIQGAKADLATGARVVRAKKVPATKVVRKRTRTSRRTGTR